MRHHLLAGITAAALLAGGANASVIILDDVCFAPHVAGESADDPFTTIENLFVPRGFVDAITISFNFVDDENDATRASDLNMLVNFDDGPSFGFDSDAFDGTNGGFDPQSADFVSTWDFDGDGSDASGFYTTTFELEAPIAIDSNMTVMLGDGFDGGYCVEDMLITFNYTQIPAPAALAGFLGLGFAGRRRRG
ncbi:MAG: hypothetical protein AB8G96_07770 [Phycisphaerales bacterium]